MTEAVSIVLVFFSVFLLCVVAGVRLGNWLAEGNGALHARYNFLEEKTK